MESHARRGKTGDRASVINSKHLICATGGRNRRKAAFGLCYTNRDMLLKQRQQKVEWMGTHTRTRIL